LLNPIKFLETPIAYIAYPLLLDQYEARHLSDTLDYTNNIPLFYNDSRMCGSRSSIMCYWEASVEGRDCLDPIDGLVYSVDNSPSTSIGYNLIGEYLVENSLRVPNTLLAFELTHSLLFNMNPVLTTFRSAAINAGFQQRGRNYVKLFNNGEVQYSFSLRHFKYSDCSKDYVGWTRQFVMEEYSYDENCNYRRIAYESRNLSWKQHRFSSHVSAFEQANTSFGTSHILGLFRDVNSSTLSVNNSWRAKILSLTETDLTFPSL
jgi:hypothetical protein